MNYKMIWTDDNGQECILHINDSKDISENVITLTPAPTPFITEEDDDTDPFAPIRTQTGIISFLYDGIFDIDIQEASQYSVILIVDHIIRWHGFLSSQNSNQSITTEKHICQVNCVDLLTMLRYENISNSIHRREFVKLRELIYKSFSLIGVNAFVSCHIFIPTEYVLDDSGEVLDFEVLWDNFYDIEKGEHFDCYSVVRDICTYFGWSLRIECENIIFYSIGASEYLRYDSVYNFANDINGIKVPLESLSVSAVDSDHTITNNLPKNEIDVSIEPTYTEELVPKIDFRKGRWIKHSWDMLSASSDVWCYSSYFIMTDIPNITFNYDPTKNHIENMMEYINGGSRAVPVIEDYWNGTKFDNGSGQYDNFNNKKKEYSWHNRIYINTVSEDDISTITTPCFAIKSNVSSNLGTGAIVIDFKRHLWSGHTESYESSNVVSTWKLNPMKVGTSNVIYDNTIINRPIFEIGVTAFVFRLRVGNKYWNGNAWVDYESSFSINVINHSDYAMESIDTNKVYPMNVPGTSGWFVPVYDYDNLNGDFELSLLYVMTPHKYRAVVFMEDFSVKYEKAEDSLFGNESENGKIIRVLRSLTDEKYNVKISMHSTFYRSSSSGLLIFQNKGVQTISYNGVKSYPEDILANKISNYYRKNRKHVKLNVWNFSKNNPFNISFMGKNMQPLSRKTDWKTGELTLLLTDYD